MINVTEREQKKVKECIKSREAVNTYNGQSAGKCRTDKTSTTKRQDLMFFMCNKNIRIRYSLFLYESKGSKVYFYNGFMVFYNFASRNLMEGSADMIALINRDELSHVRLFQNLVSEANSGALPGIDKLNDKVYELFDFATRQEIKWACHITNGNILGITEDSIDKYTKYLCNLRLRAIGFEPLYDGYTKSPYQHLEKYADTGKDANKKANFFEQGVTSYVMSSGVDGWDTI